MNKESVKQCLIRDKAFLRELYTSNNPSKVKALLNAASDIKLATLIKFLHFLANGEIQIKRQNFEAIQTHKRLQFIKKVFKLDLIKTY